jgi:hypothetical protein
MSDGRVRSGKATSEAMTAEQKTARAKAGAAKKAELASMPKATHSGAIKIGDLEIACFVLTDGRRVISGRGLTAAIGMKGRGQGASRIATHKLINYNENKDLVLAIENPIKFVGKSPKGMNQPSDGYEAIVLQEICEEILTARDKGLLVSEQDYRYSQHADLLMRGFARVGIIALVDEATGYQATREKDALAKILEAFVAKELRPWMKTFPNAYYEEIFRLYKLPYPPVNNKNWKPGFIGTLKNNVVYERLAPDILPELKKAASKAEKKARLHQWLTDDVGHPRLREHLASIVTLLKLSSSPQDFKDKVDRIHPAFGQTYVMDFDKSET